MSDSKIIRSDSPHSVSVPEGSHVAMSKSAELGSPAERITHTKADQQQVADEANNPSKVLIPKETEAHRRQVALARPAPRVSASGQASVAQAPKDAAGVEEDTTDIPQMDFPARLIHLKIANDKVRSSLDQLEKKLNTGT